MSNTPADRLVVPVELVAREIPGDRPPAVRMRLAAKQLGRQHRVQVIGWVSTEQLAELRLEKIPVDLDTGEVLAVPDSDPPDLSTLSSQPNAGGTAA